MDHVMNEVEWIMIVWREHGRRWEPARARAAMLTVLWRKA